MLVSRLGTARRASLAPTAGLLLAAVILQQSPDSHLSRVQSLLSLAQAVVLIPAAPLLGRSAATAGTAFTLILAGAALAFVALAAHAAPDWRHLGLGD